MPKVHKATHRRNEKPIPPPVDKRTAIIGKRRGLNLTGSINKKTGRVVISVRGLYPERIGYALRARVVWRLRTGRVPGANFDIHHKDLNRLNDKFGNLERLSHSKHAIEHNPKGLKRITRSCKRCRKKFIIERWRLNEKGRKNRFCSRVCGTKNYHASRRRQK